MQCVFDGALSDARMAELASPAAVLEIEAAAPWVRKWPSPWVRGPVWEGFWMLSALSLAPIVLWLAHGYSNPKSSPLDLLYFGLTALFWIGHRLSSTYLAYCTEAYRPLLRAQPIRFVVLPILVTAAFRQARFCSGECEASPSRQSYSVPDVFAFLSRHTCGCDFFPQSCRNSRRDSTVIFSCAKGRAPSVPMKYCKGAKRISWN
jgi:hypothetical protein